jgi:acetyl esterase/lipase
MSQILQNRLVQILCVVAFVGHGTLAAQTQKQDTIYTPVEYSEGEQQSRLFFPDPSIANGRAVILLHGFAEGRDDVYIWGDTLAQYGYMAMAIQYPIPNFVTAAPDERYPRPARAFKIAVEFLRSNANRYNLDTSKIFAIGRSFGAITIAQSLVWENDDEFFGTDPTIPDNIAGASLYFGAFDLDLLEENFLLRLVISQFFADNRAVNEVKGNVINLADNINVPLQLIHGDADNLLVLEHSLQLHDSLQARGKYSSLIIAEGGGHGFEATTSGDAFTSAGLPVKDSTIAFFEGIATGVVSSVEERFVDNTYFHGGSADEIILVPNPAREHVTVQWRSRAEASGKNVQIRLVDLLGREILTGNFIPRSTSGYTSAFVHLQNVPAGKYMMIVQEGNDVIQRQMLSVVQ